MSSIKKIIGHTNNKCVLGTHERVSYGSREVENCVGDKNWDLITEEVLLCSNQYSLLSSKLLEFIL